MAKFRMRNFFWLALALVSATVFADNKPGYWWKKEPPALEENDAVAEMPAPPTEAELLAMKPKEVAELIEQYKDNALWKMDKQSVAWYYQMQDFARRRSRAFMNVTEAVMLERPDLNMNAAYPLSNPGRKARVMQRNNSISNRLSLERDKVALVLLTRASCSYCPAQRATVKNFQSKHGWAVKEFDIDERPDIAVQFGTDFTPTTIAIFRNSNEWAPVGIGVDSVPKLEENTYRALRMLKGETTADRFTVMDFQDGTILDPQR